LDLVEVYQKLPVPLQNVVCSLEGWRIQYQRFGKSFMSLLAGLEKHSKWTTEEICAYQNSRLKEFINHCAGSVPYYQRKFKEWKISPKDINSIEDLRYLPVLTKEEVKTYLNEMVSENVPKHRRTLVQTSGSTGSGLKFFTTPEAVQEQWAIWWRYRRQLGINLGDWCGYFVGHSVVPVSQNRPPFWRYNYPGQQIFFSAYHMNFNNIKFYVNELQRKQPPWLHGYPSLLGLVASYLLESGTDLGYKVKWITTGAENLFANQIDLIEKAFGIRPKQHYGMTEAVANISECNLGNLHVDEDFAATEFLSEEDGKTCRVVGTNLSNLATPLLRYDTQDIITTTKSSCQCGQPGRLIFSIDGRKEDYILLKNGVRLGRLDHIFKGIVSIKEAQIYQHKIGEIIIRTVRGAGFTSEDHDKLLQESYKRVGTETKVTIEYLEQLTRSPRGKLRFVISEIPSEKLK
jgi:phenylacetate-CoA ligase